MAQHVVLSLGAVAVAVAQAGSRCGKVEIHHTLGCYNHTGWAAGKPGPVLPNYEAAVEAPELTLETCATACGDAALGVAGVDDGARCFCGSLADVSKPAATALLRPKPECIGTPCGGAPSERECGGAGRLLAYSFSCAGVPPTPPRPSPPPPPPPPPAPCTGPRCFQFSVDWASGSPASMLPHGNFSVRKLEGVWYPADNRTSVSHPPPFFFCARRR